MRSHNRREKLLTEDDLRTYFYAILPQGDIPELIRFVRNSSKMGSFGLEVREAIKNNLGEIAGINGYSQKFSSFRELVEHHQDVTSPLRELPLNNEYILLTREQKIPYEKQEFFRLLKQTKLRGVRVIFSLCMDDEGSPELCPRVLQLSNNRSGKKRQLLSFVCKRIGDKIETTLFQPEYASVDWDDNTLYMMLTRTDNIEQVFLTSFDSTPEEIDHYFSSQAEPLKKLTSNFFEIYIDPLDSLRDNIDRIVTLIEQEEDGYAVIRGVDENGEYTLVYQSKKVRELEYTQCWIDEEDILNLSTYEFRYKKENEVADYHVRFRVEDFLREDYPRLLKKSVVGFELTIAEYTENEIDFKKSLISGGLTLLKKERKNKTFCFPGEDECYLCTQRALDREFVTLSNKLTYVILEIVVTIPGYLYCYKIIAEK